MEISLLRAGDYYCDMQIGTAVLEGLGSAAVFFRPFKKLRRMYWRCVFRRCLIKSVLPDICVKLRFGM